MQGQNHPYFLLTNYFLSSSKKPPPYGYPFIQEKEVEKESSFNKLSLPTHN